MINISSKVKQVPRKPGVYLFKDEKGLVLYIGKAKVLRDRVRTYFQKSNQTTPRLISMMSRVVDLEWIVTNNEVEALLVEANLIKEHAPKYNVSLKDDKSFPYVRITREPFPQIIITRKIVKDGSKYLGPYTDVKSLRNTFKVIHKVFPVRSCEYKINEDTIARKKVSVCLDYHINKCEGPCEELVDEKTYNKMIKNVIRFLHGRTDKVLKSLKNRMEVLSDEMRFEEAAIVRDQIKSIESFTRRQRKVTANFEDKDIIALAVEESDACAVVIRLRNGKIVGREKMMMSGVDSDYQPEALLAFLRQFYLDTDFIPPEIILLMKPNDEVTITSWLTDKRGRRVKLTVPQRGEKVRLLRMTQQNAKLLLEEYLRQKERRRELIPGKILQLQSDLHLSVAPRRIEAFDISNIQGSYPVAAMVCFVDGQPKKSLYRKFKIKTVKGVDDFAMIREVVLRRYRRLKSESAQFPDLILIDGGKGQLGMAVSALRELGLTYIPLVGLAKRLEEVFIPGYSEPQSIAKHSSGLRLLQHIRDEAHRFAVTFHRKRRGKSVTHSIFHEIKGVGPVTVKKLFTNFRDIRSISRVSEEEISRKIGIRKSLAETIISTAKEFVNDRE
ncbi:MAG: excinuclease ABC subunit C [Candidatus Marinimicrobia bacterium]|nr:excinuclease ABC subunit C [Candidatus Neomarinimicrobiota bacterium]